MLELKRESNMTYLFITHDVCLVPNDAASVVVMRHGMVVERCTAGAIFSSPQPPVHAAVAQRDFLARAEGASQPECRAHLSRVPRRQSSYPPACTFIFSPVTYEAAGETSHRTAPATSSGRQTRQNGIV